MQVYPNRLRAQEPLLAAIHFELQFSCSKSRFELQLDLIFKIDLLFGDPKKVLEPYPNPKNSPLGPQKVKNDPKIKSKSNVRI